MGAKVFICFMCALLSAKHTQNRFGKFKMMSKCLFIIGNPFYLSHFMDEMLCHMFANLIHSS